MPDANVFLEMVYGRSLQSIARQLITRAIVSKIQLVAPGLFLDKITEVLCGNLDDLQKAQQHLFHLEQLVSRKVLLIVVPSAAIRMKAIEIAPTGIPKSGYPELSDALYHALADDPSFDFGDAAEILLRIERLEKPQSVDQQTSDEAE